MKRKIWRERQLDAFSINLDQMDALWTKILDQFGDLNETVHTDIEISLPKEDLEFKDLEEMKRYSEIPDRITEYKFWFLDGNRILTIQSPSSFSSRATVRARAENEAWCAGVIETAALFLYKHRLWYYWIHRKAVFWPLVVGLFIGTVGPWDSWIEGSAWIKVPIFAVYLFFLFGGRTRLFPAGTIRIPKKESSSLRWQEMTMILLGVLSVILAVISLIYRP